MNPDPFQPLYDRALLGFSSLGWIVLMVALAALAVFSLVRGARVPTHHPEPSTPKVLWYSSAILSSVGVMLVYGLAHIDYRLAFGVGVLSLLILLPQLSGPPRRSSRRRRRR